MDRQRAKLTERAELRYHGARAHSATASARHQVIKIHDVPSCYVQKWRAKVCGLLAALQPELRLRNYLRRTEYLVATLATLTTCVRAAPSGNARIPEPPRVPEVGAQAESAGVRSLAVPGFLPAVLVVPSGTDSRPLVVAAHGAGGTPEWECDYWSRLTHEQAFVLCLRGTRIAPQAGFYFRDHRALGAELSAALSAARSRFARIAPSSGIYAGFSQGASMGSLIVGKTADELSYAVLIEGFERWNIPLGRAFARRGGKGVLFVCGSRECAKTANASTSSLQRAGLRARAVYAQGAGHTSMGPVQALVASNLPWLLAGDAAWAR